MLRAIINFSKQGRLGGDTMMVRKAVLVAGILALAGTVAGCGSSASGAAGSSAGAGDTSPIPVVTSTNVWGDVVAQIGGTEVAVTPLIVDPAADPHSFEPNAQAQLSLSKAALVVENGGGYDDFMQTMTAAAGSTAPVITAVQSSGGNEHVWYDFLSVEKVAGQVADQLTTIRPAQGAFFQANLSAFTAKLAGLTSKVQAIKAAHAGTPIAVTEPVPLYLTDAAGLVNKTPPEFSKAIEEGTDVPPNALSDTLALFTNKQVVALVYNEQTSSPETEKALAAAKNDSIAAVGVTETLPAGLDYLSWMDANITALDKALQ